MRLVHKKVDRFESTHHYYKCKVFQKFYNMSPLKIATEELMSTLSIHKTCGNLYKLGYSTDKLLEYITKYKESFNE